MKVLGMIKELYSGENDYPSIHTLISDEPIEHKSEIVEYLKNGKVEAAVVAKARDVLTGKHIPMEWLSMTDGEYAWETNLIYYVEKYNLLLPDEFVKHVLERTKATE